MDGEEERRGFLQHQGPLDTPEGLCSAWGPLLEAEQASLDPGPSQAEPALTLRPQALKDASNPFIPPPPDTRRPGENPATPAGLGRGLQRPPARPLPPASLTAPFVAGGNRPQEALPTAERAAIRVSANPGGNRPHAVPDPPLAARTTPQHSGAFLQGVPTSLKGLGGWRAQALQTSGAHSDTPAVPGAPHAHATTSAPRPTDLCPLGVQVGVSIQTFRGPGSP